jgi:hypothetical protein
LSAGTNSARDATFRARFCVRVRARACRGLTRRCCSNDLSHAMAVLDADPGVSALVLTGSEKAFAAGADIKEMAQFSKVLYVVTFYVEKALGH